MQAKKSLSSREPKMAISKTFSDLAEDQRMAILNLRNQTTYLWPQIQKISGQSGQSISCDIRESTFDMIADDLTVLEDAGFFRILVMDEGREDADIIRIHFTRISKHFKKIILETPILSGHESRMGNNITNNRSAFGWLLHRWLR